MPFVRSTRQLDGAALADVLESFRALNTSRTGKLTLGEFRDGLPFIDPALATMLFHAYDADGDGFVDWREFTLAVSIQLGDDVDRQVSLAFDAYDLNQNGRLELDELQLVCDAARLTLDRLGVLRQPVEAGEHERSVRQLFALLDRDGKGYALKDDYIALVKERPELFKRLGLRVSAAGQLSIGCDALPFGIPDEA